MNMQTFLLDQEHLSNNTVLTAKEKLKLCTKVQNLELISGINL